MPTKLQELTREKINIICEAYSFISLDLENDLEPEIERWQVKWHCQEASDCPTSIGDTLSETNNILCTPKHLYHPKDSPYHACDKRNSREIL